MSDTAKIAMVHGSGGRASAELIASVFAGVFRSETLDKMEDAAVVDGSAKIAVTTDSFVITPLDFAGGNIGRLAVCGTVNDMLMRGAVPKYITCGWVIEEGAPIADIRRYAESMAECAAEAGVEVIAGDTKVVEGSGGVVINTTGVGFVPDGVDISAANIKPGDAVILSGSLGDHHAAILAARMGIETEIKSDAAPLTAIADALRPYRVHTMRDVTRGGLGTILKELAGTSGCTIHIRETALPVSDKVRDLCGILGLDPIYMGNEGKLVAFVDADDAEAALAAVHGAAYGHDAAIIGYVDDAPTRAGDVLLETSIGGLRSIDVLQGEGLPRIC